MNLLRTLQNIKWCSEKLCELSATCNKISVQPFSIPKQVCIKLCHKRKLQAWQSHQCLPSALQLKVGLTDSHRAPRAPICCSLQNAISYQRIRMSASDAGAGLGSGRCVLTAAADQTSLLAPRHPHALVNGLCLKYWSVDLPFFSAFPSSSSLMTQTFIRSTSKGIIHVKQTAWSKFSFSHALPESLWGSFTPAEVHGSADASEKGQSFFSNVKLYSGRFILKTLHLVSTHWLV